MITVECGNGVRKFKATVEQGGHVALEIDGYKEGTCRWSPRLGLYCIPYSVPRDVYVNLEELIMAKFRANPEGF